MIASRSPERFSGRSSSRARTRKDLVTALLDEYEVSEEQAAADVAAFVKKAADEGLFEGVAWALSTT